MATYSNSALVAGQIRVAKLNFCHEDPCPHLESDSFHLLVTFQGWAYRRPQGSCHLYTWGEFDGRRVPVGHDEAGTLYQMELGQEWVLGDFIIKLAEVCMDENYNACWIDQLCIPQEDAIIRETLANIPTIYRSFDVVILMPGRPCHCLEELSAPLIKAVDEGNEHEQGNAYRAFIQGHGKCVNSLGLNN